MRYIPRRTHNQRRRKPQAYGWWILIGLLVASGMIETAAIAIGLRAGSLFYSSRA